MTTIVGIPFFLGYLMRYLHQIKDKREYQLPQWNQWIALLVESWELIIITLVYALFPLWITYAFASFIDGWLWIFGTLAWIPFCFFAALCPIVICLAVASLLSTNSFESIFDFKFIYRLFQETVSCTLIPTIILVGFLFLTFPLYGIGWAMGWILYLPVTLFEIESNS